MDDNYRLLELTAYGAGEVGGLPAGPQGDIMDTLLGNGMGRVADC